MKQLPKKYTKLTEAEKLRIELFHAHLYNYHLMRKHRISIFDEEDGSIGITRKDGTTYERDGRKWIEHHINFFKERKHYDKICAVLQDVLKEYNRTFKHVSYDFFIN